MNDDDPKLLIVLTVMLLLSALIGGCVFIYQEDSEIEVPRIPIPFVKPDRDK